MAKDENKRKAYDAKHGINAYHHRYTKDGQAQAKAYDNFFNPSPKHKALKAKTGGFDHEQHAKHNRNIEAIDKKFGIGVHDPKRFK